MITLLRTDSDNPDFIELVNHLDADLAERDGEAAHSFYDQFNKVVNIKHTLVAFDDDEPVGCGAIKLFDDDAMEVKRMYVFPEHRGKGVATTVLNELQKWAKELGFKKVVLETGKNQPEAIAMYRKNGFTSIPNYGQYVGIENSVCFAKEIT